MGESNGYPVIASSLNGSEIHTAAAWIHFNGSLCIIQSAFGSGTTVQPPTGVVVQQDSEDFGVFIEYYNTVTWEPSPSPNLLLYFIFRNGVLINQVPPTVLSSIDHNQEQDEVVTYGVAALDQSYDQSPIVEVLFP
jgi:hypothetical protein